jgi:hypothetical protein
MLVAKFPLALRHIKNNVGAPGPDLTEIKTFCFEKKAL